MSSDSQLTTDLTLVDTPEQTNAVAVLWTEFLIEYKKKYQERTNDQEIERLESAYQYAAKQHRHQIRNSGEPYITHPIAVAKILLQLNVDTNSLLAAILHDTVEDTSASLEDIEQLFGKAVAELVDGMTKIGKIKFRTNQEKLAENFRKMIIAMAKDLRVVIIKLCDRLHNMTTLEFVPLNKQHRIATETLEIYAPLANRLGIYGIKSQLEDLCLKYLEPSIYQEIKSKVAQKKNERQAYIDEVIRILESELKKYNFTSFRVYGRPKHFYSIYKKMLDRKLDFEDVHDLFAFRVLVPSLKDCYEVLGIVHSIWKPMPGRFKDYIAMPKANLYQSLHTSVIRPNGEPAEIQIRTFEMHKICEYGVAAHWTYKEEKEGKDPANLKNFSWLRQIMEWQSEISDPEEFLEALKVDLFEEEIFVFTPKGDVLQLSANATALDFAFAIHSDIGLRCVGAKVNGRIVTLKHPLKSGDIIEILTSKTQKPGRDWLGFVTTSKAKNRIRSYLRSEQRDESRRIGRELLDIALAPRGLSIEIIERSGKAELIVKAGRENSLDDVLVALGYGQLDANELLERAFPEQEAAQEKANRELLQRLNLNANKPESATSKAGQKGLLVSGMNDLLVNIAGCCSPLPGEPVVGFITLGKGISVHRDGCDRAKAFDPRRKVEVTWADANPNTNQYIVSIVVLTHDKQGVLAEVTAAISAGGSNIKKAQVQISQDSEGLLEFDILVRSFEQMRDVLARIQNIPAVVSASRKII
jgi:guanosine-3',5'-bis(diphosphate) 3'-pyrophosphohydrolase